MAQLRSVTCHMGSHSVTCYPTQVNTPRRNPSHAGRYSIYLPRRDGRLSWPSWLDSALAGSWTSDLSITSPTLNQCNQQDNRTLLLEWSPVFVDISISPLHCVTRYIGCQYLSAFCSKSPWWRLTVFVVKDRDTLMMSLCQFTLLELVHDCDLQITVIWLSCVRAQFVSISAASAHPHLPSELKNSDISLHGGQGQGQIPPRLQNMTVWDKLFSSNVSVHAQYL